MKYIMIDEETLKDNKISLEHTLSADEIQILLVHKEVISKFILQKGYNIQTELGQGVWKGKEELGYEIMKQLAQIAQDVRGSEEVFTKYQADIKQKESLK